MAKRVCWCRPLWCEVLRRKPRYVCFWRLVDYDAFLAECNQAVAVDVEAAAEKFSRLILDAGLRQRLGAAGRQRVLDHFAWEHAIRSYEHVWCEQDLERQALAKTRSAVNRKLGPPYYPAPEVSFAGYPTFFLGDEARVVAGADALEELAHILGMPLCIYAGQRVSDEAILRAVLSEASSVRRIGELADLLVVRGATPATARATVAWLLKYSLLRRA